MAMLHEPGKRKIVFKNLLNFAGLLLLGILGILIRILSLGSVSADMIGYLEWFDFLVRHGVKGLGVNFAVYTPPYLYLLWVATLTAGFLPKVTAIKLIPIIGDLVNALLVYKLLKLKYPSGNKPLWAALIFFSMPTVFLNSAAWGQVDSLYTLFLLICIYCLLTERSFWAMTAFGFAFSFKAQAVFLAPFLLLMILKRRIPWTYLLLPPLVYVMMCIPSVALGRPWLDVLTIYLAQSSTFHSLSMNAPNLYIFPPNSAYDALLWPGLFLAVLLISVWLLHNRRKSFRTIESIALTALASLALVPFITPKMHDRYFYPAEVLALIVAFYTPKLWFIPVLLQSGSLLAYIVFLYDQPVTLTMIGAVFMTAAISIILWKQSVSVPAEVSSRAEE